MSKANEVQHGGTHYRTGYQHWDLLPDIGFGPAYYLGCATKYITRYKRKNGIEDLLKARHFVQKLLELTNDGRVEPPQVPGLLGSVPSSIKVKMFFEENGLDEAQREVIQLLLGYTFSAHLAHAIWLIDGMIGKLKEGSNVQQA